MAEVEGQCGGKHAGRRPNSWLQTEARSGGHVSRAGRSTGWRMWGPVATWTPATNGVVALPRCNIRRPVQDASRGDLIFGAFSLIGLAGWGWRSPLFGRARSARQLEQFRRRSADAGQPTAAMSPFGIFPRGIFDIHANSAPVTSLASPHVRIPPRILLSIISPREHRSVVKALLATSSKLLIRLSGRGSEGCLTWNGAGRCEGSSVCVSQQLRAAASSQTSSRTRSPRG